MSPSARRRFTRKPVIEIDIVRESRLWEDQPESDEMIRRAIAEAAAKISASAGELAVVLTDDSRIRALNRAWRGIDKPTNVLSFPSTERGKSAPSGLLGDIVIAYETTAREADAQELHFLHHLAHLTVHGFLHLRGYDHEADDDAEEMERLERAVLARLHIADPYAARDREIIPFKDARRS
jgi:probable rRNA maturation factor